MLSELDKTFSEKITHAEQSVRRMKKVHLAHTCTSACSALPLMTYLPIVNTNFLAPRFQ
jgi:hypothetical protein